MISSKREEELMDTNLGKKKTHFFADLDAKAKSLDTPYNILKLSCRKSYTAIGVFACVAIGTFTLASGFKSAASAEADKPGYVANQTHSTNSSNEKNQAAEIESLRKQVQATSRKFKEYQAQLFRSSHPKDQNKIAELGRLLSEKEKVNSQLSNSLKALEKELAIAQKQITNLEFASEALNSLLNANRLASENEIKDLKQEMDGLVSGHVIEKQHLMEKIELAENEKQNIVAATKSFENDKHHLLEKIETYENEKQNLVKKIETYEKEKQDTAAEIEVIENDKQNLIAKMETYETEKQNLITKMDSYEKEQQEILNDLEKKHASVHELRNEELESAQAAVAIHERRIQELEHHYNDSQAFTEELSSQLTEAHDKQAVTQQELSTALRELEEMKSSLPELQEAAHQLVDLTSQLADAHEKNALAQQELSSVLKELEEVKSLLPELQDSTQELASLKERLEQQKLASESDYEETLTIIHTYYLTSLDEISSQLNEIHDELGKEKEKGHLLQEQLDQALANQASHSEDTQRQQHQMDTLAHDLVDTKFKLVFNEQYIEQFNKAIEYLRSQHQDEIDHMQVAIEKEHIELASLLDQIQTLKEDKIALESQNASSEAELSSYKLQAERDKASAELSFIVRETELTAYQLMLQIEIERLNAEIAENASKFPLQDYAEDHEKAEETIRRLNAEIVENAVKLLPEKEEDDHEGTEETIRL